MNRMAACLGLLSCLVCFGCGQQEKDSPQDEPKELSQDKPKDLSKFDQVHRAAVEFKSNAKVGLTRGDFQKLLQRFSTELELVGETAGTPPEKELVEAYRLVFKVYQDSATVWDSRLDVPKMLAKEQALFVRGGNPEQAGEQLVFQRECATKMPLTNFFGVTRGLDAIVSRYGIPVESTGKYRFIPEDSVELLWEKAGGKMREVVQLRQK